MLVEHIFGHAEPGVLDVHLHENFAQAVVVVAVGFDPAIHVGSRDDLALAVQLQLGIDAADVFAADESDAGDRGADGEVLPVAPGDFGRAQRAGEDGSGHLHLAIPTVLGADVDGREGARVGVGADAFGKPIAAQGISLNVQMRIVDRVVFVATGGHLAKRARVNQLAAAEGGRKTRSLQPQYNGNKDPTGKGGTIGRASHHRVNVEDHSLSSART